MLFLTMFFCFRSHDPAKWFAACSLLTRQWQLEKPRCLAPDRSEVSFATMNSYNANMIYCLRSDNGQIVTGATTVPVLPPGNKWVIWLWINLVMSTEACDGLGRGNRNRAK
ncbi:uncharacterized protein FYN12_013899 isoform 2-T2 [Phoenicopterus ruber ruber]